MSHGTWVENRPRRGFWHLELRELWAYRELAVNMALRDLRVRYKQAFFGIAWALVQPLSLVIVFTLVFRRVASVPSDGLPYPVFVLVGLMAWGYTAGSVTRATQSLVSNAALVTKVYFPRMLVPVAALLPGVVDLLLAVPVLVVLCLVTGVAPGWAVLTAPLWLLGLVLVAFGTGVLLSAVNVRYRDVTQAIGLLVQLWMFLSPVAYPASAVPERWQLLYHLNPMVPVVTGLRWSLIGGPAPSAHAAASAAVVLVVVCSAVIYFQHTERRFADVI